MVSNSMLSAVNILISEEVGDAFKYVHELRNIAQANKTNSANAKIIK